MIINHDNKLYRMKWRRCGKNRFNGAFYYSKEICKNIIPDVRTDRNWITVNLPGQGCDHSIVFIHNNIHPENYDWLSRYDDVILVCGVEETVEKVSHIAPAIYLPLSVDVDYVKKFKRPKAERQGAAFVGRPAKRKDILLPPDITFIEGLPRQELLRRMSKFSEVYAVGRTAIEARILGAKIKPYDPRYPKVSKWKIYDNKDAAKELQRLIDDIDGGFNEEESE